MTAKSESGHANVVANFEKLIAHITAFGSVYNPSRVNLQIPVLNNQLGAAKTCLAVLHNAESAYAGAIKARELAFIPFSKLITRVSNALKASDSSTQIDETAAGIIRKLQGKRATPKKTEEEKKRAEESGQEIHEISTSQMGFDNRLDNFDKLIKLLASVPGYAPNEPELSIAGLSALQNELLAKNTAVLTAEPPLKQARLLRNELLYQDKTGISDIALDVKSYVKSIFGATDPQFKIISSIKI